MHAIGLFHHQLWVTETQKYLYSWTEQPLNGERNWCLGIDIWVFSLPLATFLRFISHWGNHWYMLCNRHFKFTWSCYELITLWAAHSPTQHPIVLGDMQSIWKTKENGKIVTRTLPTLGCTWVGAAGWHYPQCSCVWGRHNASGTMDWRCPLHLLTQGNKPPPVC